MQATLNFHNFHDIDDIQPSICICPECGHENDLYFDEITEKQICVACGQEMKISRCDIY